MVANHDRPWPHHLKGDEEDQLIEAHRVHHFEKGRRHALPLLLIFSLVSLSLFIGPRLFSGEPLQPFEIPDEESSLSCSLVPENSICCDRRNARSDICVLRGDVRTSSPTSSILLNANISAQSEKIRPYTRKWETSVMNTIDELNLIAVNGSSAKRCDVVHEVPAIVFSTGGYTGNVYHEFNDGIIPLYITSKKYNREVVFIILEYHSWWVSKYKDILPLLSAYPPVDFTGDKRTHCFREVTVGLKIHDELAINPSPEDLSILNFRRLLDDAYRPRVRELEEEEKITPPASSPPKLAIISRNGSRGLENEKELVSLCEEMGFEVQVLRPDKTTEMAKMYRALNSSDVMLGVHGAAMTHLLFMRPGAVFIQVVPLGTDWAAETYYGSPAKKLGLKYVAYGITPSESSLSRVYKKDDPVLRDPTAVNSRGWEVTKKVYLDGQTVRLDLNRVLKRLTRAYQYVVTRKMEEENTSLRWNENWLPRRAT